MVGILAWNLARIVNGQVSIGVLEINAQAVVRPKIKYLLDSGPIPNWIEPQEGWRSSILFWNTFSLHGWSQRSFEKFQSQVINMLPMLENTIRLRKHEWMEFSTNLARIPNKIWNQINENRKSIAYQVWRIFKYNNSAEKI